MQVVVDGVLTNYTSSNPKAKKTLVILPGWANTSQNWQAVIQNLPENYHYITLDLPGFGQSNFLPGTPNVPEYSDFVVAFIEKLKLNKPLILGHSFGGQVAMELSTRYPEKISSLLLLSPAGIRIKTHYVKARVKFAKLIKSLKKITPTPLYNYLLSKVASKDYLNAHSKQRDILNRILNFDLSTKLNQIKVPTHILWGDQDHVIPYMGKFLAENIPDSKLTVLYGMDHLPHIRKPQEFAQQLSEILDDQIS